MISLFPRLGVFDADVLLDDFLSDLPKGVYQFDPSNIPPSVTYAAIGGHRVQGTQLQMIRKTVIGLGSKCGYPTQKKLQNKADFDSVIAEWISQQEMLKSGEFLRNDVWTFISTVLLPDIVYWRFADARERYTGGIRNTFQRLWLRGHVFDRGEQHENRWGLLKELTEDAFVQILERPGISNDPVLAIAVAEAWVRAADKYGRGAMESVMRGAMLMLRAQNEVRLFASITNNELAIELDNIFDKVAESQNV